MKTAADTDNWRQKYFDSLGRLENEQREFQAMEASLKKLAGRLCTASLGQSSRLDEQIKKLQTAIRRDVSSEELEKITPALTEAIQALDQPSEPKSVAPVQAQPPASVTPIAAAAVSAKPAASTAVIGDESIRAILAALLGELRRDADLAPQADAVDSRLSEALKPEQFPDTLSTVTQMVSQRIQRIEKAKLEIETLLSHMVGKLDEVHQFIAEQHRNQTESHAASETLSVQLVGEMKAMGETVEATNDVQQIRVHVRSRLESLDRHLREFREREATLSSAMQARNEQMQVRICELESEAKYLHGQLRNEQRLSTLDALTKIANRGAYEKRVDEELKRWQRFKQPVCLAVWDVDYFKRINDTYGHRAGDRVLVTVAEFLSSRVRSTDFVARYGGEEFAMLLPGTKTDDAVRLVNELREGVARIGFHFRGTPVSVTISIGITAFQPNDSAGAAFDRADKALYRAKESGRNRCVAS
ncbi:diguanylate cyclase [Povalibacter uvarum]|uniref:diguanylate cyclase n=1 Tax=Povalibacter uvarum TaxID=732238 RepID=A0A841HTC6_9GAMM|nr:GGDEF domain-containing protein [Povalibacter uvarum]MBB6096146.1 diguanylate cyclase [Povalibacter uvarum]